MSRRNNKLLLPILIAAWVLIKIGEISSSLAIVIFNAGRSGIFNTYGILNSTTLKAINSFHLISNVINSKGQLLKRSTKITKPIKKVLLYKIKAPKVKTPEIKFTLPKIGSRKRGRPRTQPLRSFLFSKWKRTLNKIFPTPLRIAVALVLILSIFSIYSFGLIVVAHGLPSPDKLSYSGGPQTTEIYDRNGKLLYRLYEGKNRSLIKLEDVPQDLINATIAIEDKNFWGHSGVDIFGITRAAIANLRQESIQGGSTITQQLIKNTLLTPDQTIQRKLKEVALAFWAERIFDKKTILQMYFNEIAYGGPAWGIAAASQTYFNKPVKDLSLAESSYLAGLTASPTTYSPYGAYPELAKTRQKEVLRRMVEDKYITPEQADSAYNEELNIQPPVTSIKAPHFVFYVKSILAQKYGEKVVSQGGLKVYTTLDLDTQEMAENVVAEEVAKLASLNATNGAAVVTDAKNGHILAMVGSKNYWDPNGGNFNVATALRQPGSSIKPVTYATGFKLGYTPGNIMLDTPVSFKNAWENYSPVNYDGKFRGAVTIRTALGSSYNIPAVKMLALVGIPSMVQTATDMGITTFSDPDKYGLSLTLGAGEVKMVDMATVYGTFSQNGVKYEPQPILKVVDSNGVVLEDNSAPKGKRVLPAAIAYMITDILTDNRARTPAFGPDSLLKIPGYTVAVKTGTTDSKKDNWTAGYTPEKVVVTWVGNNDNTPMDPRLTSGITGASPIWNKIMTNLVKDKADVAFTKPDDIGIAVVDGSRDLVIAGNTPKATVARQQKKDKDQKDAITFTDPFSTFTQPSNP